MKKPFKYILIPGVAAVLLIIAFGFFKNPGPDPMMMITEAAKKADIQDSILSYGTLRPNKLVAVGAQVTGRLISLKVAVGQNVKQGDVIGQIDPDTKQNDLLVAQAALKNMQALRQEKMVMLALAESSQARKTTTLRNNTISQADYETAVATVDQTKAQIASLDAQIEQAQVAVKTAEVNLGYSNVVAPIDGTVLAVVTSEGQIVNAVQSAPTIVILGQLDVMSVQAEISEVDVVKVKPGQDVYFTILGEPDQRYNAKLESIDPAPVAIKNDSSLSSSSSISTTGSASAIYYNAIFRVPNADGKLRTYMTAEVHVIVASAVQALVIPSSALGARNADGTYRVDVIGADGAVNPRNVEIGINDKINAQVLVGLAIGEKVVTERHEPENTGSISPGAGPPS